MYFLIMGRGNGCYFTFLICWNFFWNNFGLLLEFTSSGAHTKLWWSQGVLGKFWKIILNTQCEGWNYFLNIKLGIVCFTSDSLSLLFKIFFKTLDVKLSSLECCIKANVYWQELSRHHNFCPAEIKNSTIQNCNKNDILKFSM